ncbi:MAG: HlyD family efflux transporter periplasmic adaptor subunit [Bacteroidetes bacterium]|nr:HlyD family efflux transporter periplasmic adaptor subunit [Bacteroidota bacterium]
MKEIREIVETQYKSDGFKSFNAVYRSGRKSRVRYWFYGILISMFLILLLPWTQNIRSRGYVTTLKQEQRPQELNSVIAGRIIKWYVKEGDHVNPGDTIVQLAEIKDNYLDPELLQRTQEQIVAKKSGIDFYYTKVAATDAQLNALEQAMNLKLKQLSMKIVSDSMDVVAATNDLKIAEAQFKRQQVMRDSGLASLVQLEQRNQYYQSAAAKKTSAEIKFMNTRTELFQVKQEYAEKMFKAQGEKASAQSEIASGQAELSKLTNQYANYKIRNGLYFLIAPQSGQVVKANKSGINEIMKEGEKIAEIVPDRIDYAVELYIRAVDLPLLSKGQQVRFLFDGFPAIVFSGWPQASYGTFSGKIVAVENSVSSNGKFRVLVGEDTTTKRWPNTLKMGAGAQGIALLKDVPIWYELWRNINGFPPEYYKANQNENGSEKK